MFLSRIARSVLFNLNASIIITFMPDIYSPIIALMNILPHLQPSSFAAKTSRTFTVGSLPATLLVMSLLLQAPSCLAQGYIKCWKNSEGLTECGNRIPREYYAKKVRFIDSQGITRKVKEQTKSIEELAIEKEKKRILDAQLAEKKKLKEHDEILLKTYLTVDDLLNALNSKLEILQSRITVLESIVETRKKQFDELVRNAADVERLGKEIPEKLQQRLDSARAEIHNLQSKIDAEKQEADKIQETYAHDVERFMITSASRTHYNLAQPQTARKSNAVRLSCSNDKQCDEYWHKANNYATQYATTDVRFSSDKIFLTATPEKEQDIAMGLTYLDAKFLQQAPDNYIIFQLRCHQSKQGQKYCQDDNISSILREFKSEMYN